MWNMIKTGYHTHIIEKIFLEIDKKNLFLLSILLSAYKMCQNGGNEDTEQWFEADCMDPG